MRRILKALIRFIFVAIPIIVIALGAGLLWMIRSLPPVSGTMAVEGLSEPVTIARDERGIPHITGASLESVLAGLGFAHAQDRLWQMEVARLAAQGRLSEVFGEATVDSDIWLRSMGFFESAEKTYQDMPADGQKVLQAYAGGINAWMQREARPFASKLPPEFVILGHEPEPWKPEHSLASLKMMSVTLGANAAREVLRLAFARLGLTAAEMDDLLPLDPADNPPQLPDIAALLGLDSGPLPKDQASLQSDAPFFLADTDAPRGASNNWVLAGDRTTTGEPLLANDPHLGLTAPSIWYLAHLRVEDGDGDRNMVGATLAGTPLLLLGRNDTIAWGLTTTRNDVQDIYIERVNPDNPEQYQTPDGWESFGVREETLLIRGGEERRFTRRWTRHGPVLPDGYLDIGSYLPKGTVASLQWIALTDDDTTMMSALKVWDAKTVEDFQAAMEQYVTPMQSIVVADKDGNIGLIAPGRTPIRDPGNLVMGRAPVPGWDAKYDWIGTIPFAGLPRQLNPENGAIATANTRMIGPDYPYFLTFDWAEPWRKERLEGLVVNNPDLQSPQWMGEVQADVQSDAFAAIGPLMFDLMDGRNDVDAEVLTLLKGWNFTMTRNSAEPLIFMAWLRESMIAIFEDDLGPVFDRWFRARAQVMQKVLEKKAARDWCDDRTTSGTETCADVLAGSLSRALLDLEQRYGTDRSKWNWGQAHVTAGSHTPFSRLPVLNEIFDVKLPSAGGPFTVDRGVTSISDADSPFTNISGSSFRGVYDFSDLEKSTFMITTGQSGNVFSRHYRDLAQPWSDVQSFTIPTDPEIYGPTIVGNWQLDPG